MNGDTGLISVVAVPSMFPPSGLSVLTRLPAGQHYRLDESRLLITVSESHPDYKSKFGR
jgi:hypothetical protein